MTLERPADIPAANRASLDELLGWLTGRYADLRRFMVTGSREWFEWRVVWRVLAHMPPAAEMLNGQAVGADALCDAFWRTQGSLIRPFPVRREDWQLHGKRAGQLRNELMVEHMPACVLGFLRHDVSSPGTRGALRLAGDREIPTFVFHYAVTPSPRGVHL